MDIGFLLVAVLWFEQKVHVLWFTSSSSSATVGVLLCFAVPFFSGGKG